MCLTKTPEQKEAERRKQFTDAGYTGSDNLWVSVGDPTSDRVYEGSKPPRFQRSRRLYYGDAFVPETQQNNATLSHLDQLRGLSRPGDNGYFKESFGMSPYGVAGNNDNKRGTYEIVMDGAYDDPNIENLSDPFYKSWAQKFAASPTEQLPDAAKLVAEGAKKKAAQTKVMTPAGSIANSFMSALRPSMQTDDNRYNNIGLVSREGVTNLVGRR